MVTLFYLNTYGWDRPGEPLIKSEEFERTTEHFAIRPNGRRESLANGYQRLFSTKEEVVDHCAKAFEQRVESASKILKSAQENLAAFKRKCDQEGLVPEPQANG